MPSSVERQDPVELVQRDEHTREADSSLTREDIEHAPVHDDPRKWSRTRKTSILIIVSFACAINGLGSNIYNPSIPQIERQLHATPSEMSLSLSLYILLQGGMPFIWSALSEIKGRKRIYVVSIALNLVGCICVATARTIGLVISMRCVQATGASAVMSIGAATLADIYEPSERGTMIGVYYTAPLLGPSIGPILGGILTQFFDWRATFWFMAIFAGLNLLSFVLMFKDSFRRERSLTYQLVLQRLQTEQSASIRKPGISTPSDKRSKDAPLEMQDAEVQATAPASTQSKKMAEIRLSLKDVNPIVPGWIVMRRLNNFVIFISSGLIFAFGYSITYTCVRTLARAYHFDALKIGLTLLAFGGGSIAGSLFGGRYSDAALAKARALRGVVPPEVRLASTRIGMLGLPPAALAYAWLCAERVHVAAVCVALFACGFFSIWIYATTLAYLVDANAGRSSTAVAMNSFHRGLFAFVAAEVAVPLQDSIGDGGLYTLWGGLLILTGLLIQLVLCKGERWRAKAEAREAKP